MRLPSLLVLVVVAASLAVAAAPASGALLRPETLYLDSFEPANDGDSGPVSTSDVLEPGRQYIADVSGTFSSLAAEVWSFNPERGECGTPDTTPMTPSPGQIDSPVGQDAEMRFASPWQRFCPALPNGSGFQIDIGAGFGHPVVTGGPYAAPTPGHRYSYLLVGAGQPARFRLDDRRTSDDNGILTIAVHPAQPVPAAINTAPAAPAVVLPAPNRCLAAHRRIHLRLKARKGDAITAASVRVNGRTVRRVNRSRGRARRVLDLHVKTAGNRKTGKASVLVVARTRHGRVVVTRKVYKVCKA